MPWRHRRCSFDPYLRLAHFLRLVLDPLLPLVFQRLLVLLQLRSLRPGLAVRAPRSLCLPKCSPDTCRGATLTLRVRDLALAQCKPQLPVARPLCLHHQLPLLVALPQPLSQPLRLRVRQQQLLVRLEAQQQLQQQGRVLLELCAPQRRARRATLRRDCAPTLGAR